MLDLSALGAALEAHGRVARVVVAEARGSAPREAGAAMLVWAGGQSGTIGGGALEWEAAARARDLLAQEAPAPRVDRLALGPALGQCCGGSVVLVTEVLAALPQTLAGVRALALDDRPTPLGVHRMLDRARAQGTRPGTALVEGWLVEPVAGPQRALWVWGAGHVGRALVAVMAPLPGLAITWIDTAPDRFPPDPPRGVRILPAPDPVAAVALAPPSAEHLVLTFSHALDLALCHRLLGHGFARLGLIGSATKRARFASRLADLGHTTAEIARVDCPIGDPALGKHPQAIAIGVSAAFLARSQAQDHRKERRG
jgi:xanthine dehydrogenase accessory factor